MKDLNPFKRVLDQRLHWMKVELQSEFDIDCYTTQCDEIK